MGAFIVCTFKNVKKWPETKMAGLCANYDLFPSLVLEISPVKNAFDVFFLETPARETDVAKDSPVLKRGFGRVAFDNILRTG